MEVRESSAKYLAKAAYKQTEVGEIPEDWDYVRLTSVAQLESGHTPSRRHSEYWNGDIPWVSLHDTDFLDVREIHTTTQTVTAEGIANSSARLLPKGTVVFSRTATVGKATCLGREMATSQDFANYICGPRVFNHYLVYLFRWMSPEWKKLMAGSIHNTVYMPAFKALKVRLPSHKEQQAIAEALSDTDALIESLEQLLAKKRHIRQGAMQELLTGQKRLPGFAGEWEVRPFDGVLRRINGKAHQIQTIEYQLVGRYPVVDQGKEQVIAFSDQHDKRFQCPAHGAIVFGDHTCIAKYVDFDFLIGADGTQVLLAIEEQCARFLAFQLEVDGIKPTGYNRHFRMLKDREFLVPTLPEQTAIATILSDMDAEIAALEAKLAKARRLKLGMMSELLTGRIRLV